MRILIEVNCGELGETRQQKVAAGIQALAATLVDLTTGRGRDAAKYGDLVGPTGTSVVPVKTLDGAEVGLVRFDG